jgi:c-di-GMP-binding flagellar brake protein YcgR
MSDHYQLISKASAREDSAAIVAVLQKMHHGELSADLRLLNYYEEIPVSYPARIEFIEDDMVDVLVHQHQSVVMKLSKKTILKSQHFEHEVLANVFRVDIGKTLATLTNFAYVVVRAERRRFVRVTVKDRFEVIFTDGERKLRGSLCDISLTGVAVVSVDGGNNFDTLTDGTLLLSLGDKPISLPSRLLKIDMAAGEQHYIFEFEASSRDEIAISHFIFQRQVEIIKDLKDAIV